MSQNIQVLLLISKKFMQLETGFGAFMVQFHKFWALLYSSHEEMNIEEHISSFLVTYYM